MRPDERGGDERDRTRGAGNHRGTAAGEGDDDADDEGGEEADLRIDACHEGEGDDLGDKGEGADHAGEDLASNVAEAGEPLGAVARQEVGVHDGYPQSAHAVGIGSCRMRCPADWRPEEPPGVTPGSRANE